jgi:predicted amino acid racemase
MRSLATQGFFYNKTVSLYPAIVRELKNTTVRYFAGVRTAETHRLRESDLKLEQDLLEVPATKSKTRARRLVTVLSPTTWPSSNASARQPSRPATANRCSSRITARW